MASTNNALPAPLRYGPNLFAGSNAPPRSYFFGIQLKGFGKANRYTKSSVRPYISVGNFIEKYKWIIYERNDVMSTTDFEAIQKWAKLPQNIKKLLLANVFCPSCGVTTIEKYTLHDDEFGILLKGKCSKCGMDVARVVENE